MRLRFQWLGGGFSRTRGDRSGVAYLTAGGSTSSACAALWNVRSSVASGNCSRRASSRYIASQTENWYVYASSSDTPHARDTVTRSISTGNASRFAQISDIADLREPDRPTTRAGDCHLFPLPWRAEYPITVVEMGSAAIRTVLIPSREGWSQAGVGSPQVRPIFER